MHCLTNSPMSSCFVATSNSCCISNEIMLNQSQCCYIEFCESSHPCCAVHNAFCTTPISQRLFEKLSVIWLCSSPGFHFFFCAAWAVFKQCKLLSVCGVSFQMLFHQVEFCAQLLHLTLCRNQYLKHDYMAISGKTCCYLHQRPYFVTLSVHAVLYLRWFLLPMSCLLHRKGCAKKDN